jgi:hypothetical protein
VSALSPPWNPNMMILLGSQRPEGRANSRRVLASRCFPVSSYLATIKNNATLVTLCDEVYLSFAF